MNAYEQPEQPEFNRYDFLSPEEEREQGEAETLEATPEATVLRTEMASQDEHKLGLYGICKKCGAWPIATGTTKCKR